VKATVLGAGSWGTTFAQVLWDAGTEAVLWARGAQSAQAREVTRQTAEGVTSYAPVLELARKHGVEMPITEVVAALIAGDLPVGDAAAVLLSRSAKPEWYGA
jgi:glycerol-3-phosphate dehydrogenase